MLLPNVGEEVRIYRPWGSKVTKVRSVNYFYGNGEIAPNSCFHVEGFNRAFYPLEFEAKDWGWGFVGEKSPGRVEGVSQKRYDDLVEQENRMQEKIACLESIVAVSEGVREQISKLLIRDQEPLENFVDCIKRVLEERDSLKRQSEKLRIDYGALRLVIESQDFQLVRINQLLEKFNLRGFESAGNDISSRVEDFINSLVSQIFVLKDELRQTGVGFVGPLKVGDKVYDINSPTNYFEVKRLYDDGFIAHTEVTKNTGCSIFCYFKDENKTWKRK